jgi:hypothetical protein
LCVWFSSLSLGAAKFGVRQSLSDVAGFGFSKPQAVALALDIQQTVKANWEPVFNKSGITAAELERLRNCFIACDEPIQQLEDEAF